MFVKLHRHKPHQEYFNQGGVKVIGASTIASVDKPSTPLMWWAHKLAVNGKCWADELKSSADIGTISHFLVECDLRGDTPDLSDFSNDEVSLAQPSYEKFLEFWRENKIEPLAIEAQLVSEAHGYGGTIDLAGEREGDVFIFDWKTSKAIYDSHLFQLTGYLKLWNENHPDTPASRACIVRIGKNRRDHFEQRWLQMDKLDAYWRVFLANLEVLNAKKALCTL